MKRTWLLIKVTIIFWRDIKRIRSTFTYPNSSTAGRKQNLIPGWNDAACSLKHRQIFGIKFWKEASCPSSEVLHFITKSNKSMFKYEVRRLQCSEHHFYETNMAANKSKDNFLERYRAYTLNQQEPNQLLHQWSMQ